MGTVIKTSFALVLLFLVARGTALSGQSSWPSAWGVSLHFLGNAVSSEAGHLGGGRRLAVWRYLPLGRSTAVKVQAGFRQSGGYRLGYFAPYRVTLPTVRRTGWELTRISDFYHLDLGLDILLPLGSSPRSRWSYGVGFRYSRLVGTKGLQQIVTYTQTSTVIGPGKMNNRGIYSSSGSLPVDNDFRADTHDNDIGVNTVLTYTLTEWLRIDVGGEIGFLPLIDRHSSKIQSNRRYVGLRVGLDVRLF